MVDLDSLDGVVDIINDSKNICTPAPETSSSPSGPNFATMSQKDLTCMLITANVGTIFEESTLLELWFKQLKEYLTKFRPQLVAIHCQEVGGKNYESSMKHVSNFTDKIVGDESIVGEYSRVRIFLDENFESLEKFTALGSLYLIHDSVNDVKLYNFKTSQYESVEGRIVHAGNSTDKAAEHVEKVKFPQELFPECRWSRKGFMRTRWLFNDGQPLDLVNIHLFHDASNLVAMETTPSPYAQNRQKALEFTLKRIATPLADDNQNRNSTLNDKSLTQKEVPLFIFGDFNFRLDTNKVIQRITDGLAPVVKKNADSDEVLEIIYHRRSSNNNDANLNQLTGAKIKEAEARKSDDGNSNYIDGTSGVVMTVGKKLFDCENLDETFRATKNTEWLQELDNELDSFKSQLYEFKISFSPSYPFKEDTTGGYSYMKTRCPAWCDRILFNSAGSSIIQSTNLSISNDQSEKRMEFLQNQGGVIYRLMGNDAPMGDHKPVLLYCRLNLSNDNPSGGCNTSDGFSSSDSCQLIKSTAM